MIGSDFECRVNASCGKAGFVSALLCFLALPFSSVVVAVGVDGVVGWLLAAGRWAL